MDELKNRIIKDGIVAKGNILKVGSFLNHQLDTKLLDAMGKEWARRMDGTPIDKILTIEASGIALATAAARHFGQAPVVFARKSAGKNLTDDIYSASVVSYTHGTTHTVLVEKRMLTAGERVFIVDDFLAKGQALRGLLEICRQAEVEVQGIGIAIEKAWQTGGAELRELGYRIESLARIASMDATEGSITFID